MCLRNMKLKPSQITLLLLLFCYTSSIIPIITKGICWIEANRLERGYPLLMQTMNNPKNGTIGVSITEGRIIRLHGSQVLKVHLIEAAETTGVPTSLLFLIEFL